MSVSRREFLVGCSAAVAAMSGGRVGQLIFANPAVAATGASTDVLVVVFLRGGCDGLSLLSPYDDGVYVASRGSIAIPGSGPNAALPLTTNNPSFTSSLGFHPQAAPLRDLYAGKQLALIHACGLNDSTRSHFDAMDYIERGTPGNKTTPSGWLTRHLQTAGATGLLPALASGSAVPTAFLGENDVVAMTDAANFGLSTPWRYNSSTLTYNMLNTASQFYGGSSATEIAGTRTLETIKALKSKGNLNYTPAAGVVYPDGSFGDTLQLVAQTVKLDMGLQVATVDYGGWDTHEAQGNAGTGYYANHVDVLARGLDALYSDLATQHSRLTVVVMSEFGRRLGVNSSGGTDHGHGNVMMVLGGNVNGGKVYGRWPGLLDLDQGEDLKITTDYRTILSEILIRRMSDPHLGTVFPGFSGYAPLGVVRGTDLPVDYTAAPAYEVFLPSVSR